MQRRWRLESAWTGMRSGGGTRGIPCVKRNVMGAVNAMTSADMTMAGIFSKIPPDEVIDCDAQYRTA